MSERERSDGRFHILQPNRDLESNWAVDVAKQLEEYLLEICSSVGLDENGCLAVNFAEAALLLQGSIQVYSRKVEYLYTLVVHALEFISQKRITEAEKQTELAAHVSTWKQRIEHCLEEQELYPPFDIHEYGEKFMAKMSSETDFGSSRSFTELIGGLPKYEIARTFSALLQLVNSGNVALDKGKSSNGLACFTAVNPFYVKLLSNNRKHEEMLNIRVPSVARKHDTKKKGISSPAKNFDDENHLLDGTSTALLASPTELSPSSGRFCKAGKSWSIKCTPEGKRSAGASL